MTSPANAAINNTASTADAKPAIIATRQHCEADGVGLSHYILMDRAASSTDSTASTDSAAAAELPAAAAAATA